MSTPAYVEEWESGAWDVTVEKNRVDGYPRDVVLSTHAAVRFSNAEGDSDDRATMASLFLRYRDNATELFIHWDGEFFYGASTDVGYSIDGSEPSAMAWNNSSSAQAIFYPDDEFPLSIFLNRLVNASVLWVAADIGNGAMLNARFELDGLEQAIALLRDAGGFWRFSASQDLFDDSTTTVLSLHSDGPGNEGNPMTLVLRHKSGQGNYSAYINWNIDVGPEDPVLVQFRMGENSSQITEWNLSTDHEATFYAGNVQAFIRDLVRADRLLVRITPYRSFPIIAMFDLRGLDRVVGLLG